MNVPVCDATGACVKLSDTFKSSTRYIKLQKKVLGVRCSSVGNTFCRKLSSIHKESLISAKQRAENAGCFYTGRYRSHVLNALFVATRGCGVTQYTNGTCILSMPRGSDNLLFLF